MTKRIILSFLLMAGLWALLSGMFKPLMLILGFVSCLTTALLCERFGLLNSLVPRLVFSLRLVFQFAPWLLWQIIKSNLDVSRRVWQPSLPIGPCVVRVPSTQRTALGLAVHANSITLTPGTLSVTATDGEIEVHALAGDIADALTSGDFDRRVTALEPRGEQGN